MPDMQTEMKRVMQQQAVVNNTTAKAKPLMERIWLYVKDHPGLTAGDIIKRTGWGHGSVYDCLYRLLDRGMLIDEEKPVAMPALGSQVVRNVKHYRVNPKLQGIYELWAAPHKPPKQQPVAGKPQEAAFMAPPVALPVASAQQLQPGDPDFDLDSLPLGKARRLYEQLHKLFGK